MPRRTSSFFPLFSVTYSLRSLNGTQQKSVTCSELSAMWKCGTPSPTNLGPKATFFRWFRNLIATLTAYMFGTKQGIHKRVSALQTTRGVPHRLKTTWTLVHKRLQIGMSFHLSSINSPFHFIARLLRRRSANGTQPNFVKRWMVGRANNLRREVGVVPPEKLGAKKLLRLFGFSTTSRLNGEYLLN